MGVTTKTSTGDVKASIVLHIPEDLKEKFSDYEIKYGKIIFDKFMLRNVSRSKKPISQIVQTNKYPILYVLGERAKVYNFSLSLLDGGTDMLGDDYGWLNQFEKINQLADAKALVDNEGLKLKIVYGDKIATGVWLDVGIRENADQDKVVSCDFQMFVTDFKTNPIPMTTVIQEGI